MRFEMKNAPAKAEQVFTYGNIRLSVISRRILRVEKSENGVFCDKATQMVVCRDFEEVKVRRSESTTLFFFIQIKPRSELIFQRSSLRRLSENSGLHRQTKRI